MFHLPMFTEESSFMGWLIAVLRAYDIGGRRALRQVIADSFTTLTAISCAIQEAALGCSNTTLCGGGSTIDRKRFDHMRNASRFSSSYSWTL